MGERYTDEELDRLVAYADAYPNQYLCVRNLVVALKAERAKVERLQAIMDKWPKTADNVPVVPGMMVWHCPDYQAPNPVRLPGFYCLGSRCYDSGCQGDGSSGRLHGYDECYSTREAAEAEYAAAIEKVEREAAEAAKENSDG